MANRRSLQDVLRADYLLDETIDTAGMQALFNEKKDHYPCPSEGELTMEFDAETGSVFIGCKLHSGAGASLGDKGTIDNMKNVLDSLDLGERVDSSAMQIAGSRSEKVVAALKAAGIDISKLSDVPATSWMYHNENKMFYWADADISAIPVDQLPATIPVMRYNFKTGTYTVWEAEVKRKTEMVAGGQHTYTVIESEKKKLTEETDAKKQTYDQAVADYKKATADKG